MSLIGGLKKMVTNAAIRILDLRPATDKKIVINEPLSHVGNVTRNRLWYRGEPSELDQFFKATANQNDLVSKSRFWAATPSADSNIRKMHSGLPAMIADRLTDIVVADIDNIEVTTASDVWEEIEKENKFNDLIEEAITKTLVEGDGAFKISGDSELSKYPIIEFFSGDRVDYKFNRGRLTDVLFYTSYRKGSKEYVLEEDYGKRYITYKLYLEGKEVPLTSIEETATLVDATYSGDYIAALPLKFFKSPKFENRGKSVFDTKSDAFDSLDEVISQWIDAFRDGRVNKYIPDCLLPRNPETGEVIKPNPFDNRYISTGSDASENARNEIKTTQAEINYEAFIESYAKALDLCLQGIISPATLGIDLKKTDNAEAQREKEKTTLYTRGKMVDTLTEVIPCLIDLILKVNDELSNKTPGKYEATIEFGEYASPSFDNVVDIVGKAKSFGIMSIEQCIDEMYGDTWTDEDKAKEVQRIKEQNGMIETEEPKVVDEEDLNNPNDIEDEDDLDGQKE
ncbi:capsid protein [Clostridium cadaveris]|uniref:capsid protein n=1 Tax=Clostridium cadaveris TaxID=1529 RepID=UPI001FAC6513|nr:capsid protein [Clostridium cadaveris]